MTQEPRELAEGKLRLDFPADHVARLTIDNPAKRNALDHEILDAFATTLPQIEARCLLVTATGPVFSAGYDIGNLPRAEFAGRAEALVAHPFHEAIEALDAFAFPTVAALNGHAIGGGLELAVSCDLRVAAETAKMGMPPARLGLVYSHTGLRKFIDAIGVPRTRELFFTARNIDARTALQWGLVNEIVRAGRDRRRRRSPTPPASPRSRRSRWRGTSARCASCWPPRARSTPRSSASWWSCARRASAARTSSRACARSPRSARRGGRVADAKPTSVHVFKSTYRRCR